MFHTSAFNTPGGEASYLAAYIAKRLTAVTCYPCRLQCGLYAHNRH